MPRISRETVPDINITSEDGLESSYTQPAQSSTAANSYGQQSPTLEATDELSTSVVENDTETSMAIPTITLPLRNSNGSANNGSGGNGGGSSGTGTMLKKKTRLRKMGSRQNSKTESDSSDDDNHSILETPRRLKRKNYRLKQRSFDEDPSSATIAEDVVYTFRVKPPIHEASELTTASATVKAAQLTASTSLPNVFVKTKRKLFTAVQEPTAIDGVAVIEHEIQHNVQHAELNSKASLKQTAAGKASSLEKQDSNELSRKLQELELQVKPRILLAHKSISLDDVRPEFELNEEKRKSYSLESLKNVGKEQKDAQAAQIRRPLATDSFRLNCNKAGSSRESPLKYANLNNLKALWSTSGVGGATSKKQHLYKKQTERTTAIATKGAALKKIEQKLTKTNSGSLLLAETEAAKLLSPNKQDNTVPRIARKLERKSLTPTSKLLKFDYPMPANSEPTSPVMELPSSKPMTPLSERAIRLQKAKEEFLKSKPLPKCEVKLRDNAGKQQYSADKRQSDISLSSVNTTADEGSSCYGELLSLPSELSSANDLHKSISADTIRAETPPTQSDTGTDQDFGGLYDSLPRQVTRSGKISSKLGFATLASKLKKVKGVGGTGAASKKNKDSHKSFLASRLSAAASGAGPNAKAAAETAGSASSALSALCRQSLFADIIAVPQIIADENRAAAGSGSAATATTAASAESVKKSQSSPHAILRGSENSSGDLSRLRNIIRNERLNKSQSEQLVKRHKESYV